MHYSGVSVSSAKPGQCDGCGGAIPDGSSIIWVGCKRYHTQQCYDRDRPPHDVWRERCRRVDQLEYELALAKRDRDEAAKRLPT